MCRRSCGPIVALERGASRPRTDLLLPIRHRPGITRTARGQVPRSTISRVQHPAKRPEIPRRTCHAARTLEARGGHGGPCRCPCVDGGGSAGATGVGGTGTGGGLGSGGSLANGGTTSVGGAGTGGTLATGGVAGSSGASNGAAVAAPGARPAASLRRHPRTSPHGSTRAGTLSSATTSTPVRRGSSTTS